MRKIKSVFVATIATIAILTAVIPAASAEAAQDTIRPVLESVSLINPGPFEPGDVVQVAFTAHDEGGNGVTELLIYLTDPLNKSHELKFTFAPGQASVSETVEFPITADWGTGTVSSTRVTVSDGRNSAWTGYYELGFGIGGPAKWHFTDDPMIFSDNGEEIFDASVGTRLNARWIDPTFGPQWSPTPTFRWQWLRDGIPIEGATGETYVVQFADGGSRISLQATTTRPGYEVVSRTSFDVKVPPGPPMTVGTVVVEGDPVVGGTLTATTSGWSPEPDSYYFEWRRNGQMILFSRSASPAEYTVQPADIGKSISVLVVGKEPGYTEGVIQSHTVFIPEPSTAPAPGPKPLGTGAVSIKGPSSELLPGVTVEIRKNNCDGQAVWRTTTTDRPDAYGAFGIGLEQGTYCIKTLAVPSPYSVPADVTFTMEARFANWVTVWVPGPVMVTGALVAKNSSGTPINGVTAYIREGSCAEQGRGVWQNTTAANRWAEGGFGISLSTGVHCVSTLAVPSGYQIPGPYQIEVTAPSPYWITTWVPGNGPSTGTPAPYYANCTEVRAAGAAPLYRGQPGYGSHLDRDGDGVACER
ncbi:excalibur calcium-binding domain-containing protein [Microbacterium testaceum]|uniref:excalibur calcium-binding domain-containing protein n=1 Tax=Microbacterium testaceum TaxID=2033 RepID=UPI001CD9F25D|nr:excalibur calcium-binding domain-containing protein [Microbacterium testaceum]